MCSVVEQVRNIRTTLNGFHAFKPCDATLILALTRSALAHMFEASISHGCFKYHATTRLLTASIAFRSVGYTCENNMNELTSSLPFQVRDTVP